MPRHQKVTEKVFAEIAETPQKKGSYDTFLNIDSVLGLPEDGQLKELKDLYSEIIEDQKNSISALAAIEEVVIQIRCKRVINKEIRLSLSRNYIYARSIFYRRGNTINDIRVVVGTTQEYGSLLDVLIDHPTFRPLCVSKLQEAMNKEIETNIEKIQTFKNV